MSLTEELVRKLDGLDCLSHLECDGMTRVVSYVLRQHGVAHEACFGTLEIKAGSPKLRKIDPHWWIDLGGEWIIDYRARMWLGKDKRVPHGVFPLKYFPKAVYDPIHHQQLLVPKIVFEVLTHPAIPLPDEIECAKREAHRPL